MRIDVQCQDFRRRGLAIVIDIIVYSRLEKGKKQVDISFGDTGEEGEERPDQWLRVRGLWSSKCEIS